MVDSTATGLISATESMVADAVPVDLRHRLVVRVIAEQWSAGRLTERPILEHLLVLPTAATPGTLRAPYPARLRGCAMILVELDGGSRRQLTSHAELAEAIGRGEVGPSARVYHQLRDQWLPITHHPEFQRRWAAGPLPPLERTRWTFFSVDPDEAHRPATEQLRRPGSHAAPGGPGQTGTAVEEAAAPSRWRRALGTAMRRLRPKQKD